MTIGRADILDESKSLASIIILGVSVTKPQMFATGYSRELVFNPDCQ